MRRRLDVPVERRGTAGDILRRRGVSARLLSQLKKLPDGIMLGGVPCRCTQTVSEGQCITVLFPDETNPACRCERYVPVLYEDEDYIVFDKPPFLPVHRSAGHGGDTLENISPQNFGYHVINRLDRDTTGAVLVAKHAFAVTDVKKIYTAICCGHIEAPMHIDMPIARESGSLMRRRADTDGAAAVTDVKPLAYNNGFTLADMFLSTGRTHQIRVHMSYSGYPLAGDTMYGSDRSLSRQALHCRKLTFVHRMTGKPVTVTSPLPEDMLSVIKIDNIASLWL